MRDQQGAARVAWGWGVIVLPLAVTAAGWAAGDALIRRCAGVDLTVVPLGAPAYASSSAPTGSWRTYRWRTLSLTVPPVLIRRQAVSSAPEALVLTDRRYDLWVSVTTQRVPGAWVAWWYRACLYARHNPLALLGKRQLIPSFGARTPQVIDQRLGPWQGYLYCTPRRVVAHLFSRAHRATVVVVSRRDAVDLQVVREILASLKVGGPSP